MTFARWRLGIAVVVVAVMVVPPPAQAYPRPASTQVVSSYANGKPANGFSSAFDPPVFTPSGRYVAFTSIASDLVPGDVNGAYDVFRKDLATGKVALVSAGLDGRPGLGSCPVTPWYSSLYPSISDDGRFVAFTSCAANLVAGDVNLERDVFVRDVKLGKTVMASVTPGRTPPLPSVWSASLTGSQALSADGRYLVFQSLAETLVPGDTNRHWDVFLRDLVQHTTTRISVGATGQQANGSSYGCNTVSGGGQAAISANGRFVAFAGSATNLVASDANGAEVDVFVRDLQRKTNEIVSVNDHGVQGHALTVYGCPSSSGAPSISGSGRYVSFFSWDSNLIPNDDINRINIFVRDRTLSKTTKVDVPSTGEAPHYADPAREAAANAMGLNGSLTHAISRDGRYVAVHSFLQLSEDAGDEAQTYLHDRVTGATELISAKADGTPGRTGFYVYLIDGRRVAFSGMSTMAPGTKTEILSGLLRHRGVALGTLQPLGAIPSSGSEQDTPAAIEAATDPVDLHTSESVADITGARVVYRPRHDDLFVRIDLAGLGRGHLLEALPRRYGLRLSTDGADYQVTASLLGRPTGATTVLPSTIVLSRCVTVCTPAAVLRGGIGTTGSAVTFAIPQQEIGLDHGGRLTSIEAFTADARSHDDLDTVTLR